MGGDGQHTLARRAPGVARSSFAILAALVLITACDSTTSPAPAASGATPDAGATPSSTPQGVQGGTTSPGDRAFSDSHPFNANAWELFANNAEAQICAAPAVDAQPMDLDTAIANVRGFLDDGAGAGAMEAFDRSPDAASVEAAKTAAAAAVLSNNEAGAVAALLAAARLEPDNARHLVNAAGLLPAFGLSNESLAFLAAAEAMGDPAGEPFGINQRAVRLNNQGRALLGLQRWGEAATLLTEAAKLDPTLSEASLNLSLAMLCQGDRDGAMRFAMAGRYRKSMRFTESEGVSTPDPEDVYDLSAGEEATDSLVLTLTLPATADQGAGLRNYFGALKEEILQRMAERNKRQVQIQTEQPLGAEPQMTQIRTMDIMLAISALSVPGGKTAAQWDEFRARSAAPRAIFDEHFGTAGAVERMSSECTGDFAACMQAVCIPATTDAHARWQVAMEGQEAALRAWAEAYYPLATAIAAHLGDPARYEQAMISIQTQLDSALLAVVSEAEVFTMFEDNNRGLCVEAPAPPSADEATLTDAPAGKPCPMEVGKWELKWRHISISVACSDWQLEVSTPGPIGAFLQITSRRGETTIFAGPTGSASIGPLEASTKGGLYMTVAESGEVQDFGYRVEPGSIDAGKGITMNVAEVEAMDFSFVGIGAYLPWS